MRATHAERPQISVLSRYALAVGFVSAALLLSLALHDRLNNPFWLLFSAAVIAGTWYGGRWPGWLAVGLSTVAVLYFFIPPVWSWEIKPRDLPFLIAFAACQMVANGLVSWRRETEDALRRARDELEIRVAERTAELEQANEALRNQIAEQRRTEEALQLTRTELARVVRITTIGELTASIAHEVNQPLAAVVANADACVAWLNRQEPDLVEARAAADRAIQGATRASEVITRIRSLINKAIPERSRVQINQAIEETIALAGGQAARNNVSLVAELAPDVPLVLGDKIQLQQVILNLVMNGIEAMTGVTGRERRLIIHSQMHDAAQIRVSVRDSGIGVTPEVMARLFEPFFTTRSQGMGMGLPISRSIIEAHGGRLWAESTVSEGSVFQFTLPSVDGSAA